jgi:surface polysaccharide O-acyltransferase-like enzyme
MRRSYAAGTASTGKQILQNAYIKRQLPHNHCKRTIRYRAKETTKSCDKNFYVFKNGKYSFYNIITINSDKTFTCKMYSTKKYDHTGINQLSWENVGVYRVHTLHDKLIKIDQNDVSGKAIVVLDCIITCPNNVLQE